MPTDDDPMEPGSTTRAVILTTILVVGLPLNAVSLWILIRRHSCRSPSAVFMINLAFTDLLLVAFLPGIIYYEATGLSPLGSATCTFTNMVLRQSLRTSIIIVTFIGLDRLLAVVYPIRSRHLRTTQNAWKVCCFVWFFLLLIHIPEGIDYSHSFNKCNSTCFAIHIPSCGSRRYMQAMGFFFSALALSLLVVNVVSTAKVTWTLRNHVYTLGERNKISIVLIFMVNMLIIVICFLPISFTVLFFNDNKPAIRAALCLACVNCCLDPLVYYFALDAFWKKKEDVSPRPVATGQAN